MFQMLFIDSTFNQSNIGVLRLVISLLKLKASLLLVLITLMMSHQFHSVLSSYKPLHGIFKRKINFYMKNELISDL